MKQNNRRVQGFTLVELLIVIAIIAVLTILGGTNYLTSLKRGRDARRMADLEQVKAALEMYRTDNLDYPASANFAAMNTELITGGYTSTTFTDPKGGNYFYTYASSKYELCALLEVSIPTSTCTDAGWNYGIVSP